MVPMPRFHDTGRGSFFGGMAYQRLWQRHSEHFLVAVQQLFDWESRSQELVALYQGRGRVGRPPYPPVLIFKMPRPQTTRLSLLSNGVSSKAGLAGHL